MRTLIFALLIATSILAQQPSLSRTVTVADSNLPAQPVGQSDLLSIFVYGAPELTRTVRVGADGYIRLPMLKQRIKAEGLYPADMEIALAKALEQEQLLVDPYVTVNIAEYHSRPIVVGGAVKSPLQFQAEGPIKLLEAIARAQGLSDDAGQEILVTYPAAGPDGKKESLVRHIPRRRLIDQSDAELNLTLTGGEQVSVPVASKVYVLGNVKHAGAYPLQDTSETTLLQVLALSEGLAPFSGKVAYIYRADSSGKKNEIAVPLDQIMRRKAPDVQLLANDILYVPDKKGTRMTLTALDRIANLGSAATQALIYTIRP